MVQLTTHHANFLWLFIVLFGVGDRTSSHQRIQAEQKQHVEEQQTNDADDEDYNHLLTTTHTDYRLYSHAS